MRFDTKSNTVVVTLDINRQLDEKVYQGDFDSELSILTQRLVQVCEELKITQSDSAWIIAWQEYGIRGENSHRALTPQQKDKFKKSLQTIAQNYPNATIVAGTIQTAKFHDRKEKINEIIK